MAPWWARIRKVALGRSEAWASWGPAGRSRVIEATWQLLQELAEYIKANFDPVWGTIDILIITLGLYWLLLLIRGTRAVQILVGVIVLIALSVASQFFQFATTRWILDTFMGSAVLIIVVLFQHDIRRALARVGRFGFFLTPDQEESAMVEEVVRAAQVLAQRGTGALIVLERETGLDDQIEAGQEVGAVVSKELLTSLFLPGLVGTTLGTSLSRPASVVPIQISSSTTWSSQPVMEEEAARTAMGPVSLMPTRKPTALIPMTTEALASRPPEPRTVPTAPLAIRTAT